MKRFLQRHAAAVMGVLSGFDRLVFRGTLRDLAFAQGLMRYFSYHSVLLKEAGAHFEALSSRVKAMSVARAEEAGRPVIYLPSPQTRKEKVAREIAAADGITAGLVCVLTSVEPCQSFEIHRSRETQRLELRSVPRKCLHVYHYWLHSELGLAHARVQTWFPFTMQVCLNGREWLARQLDGAGQAYRKADNCFLWLRDPAAAQRLADAQLETDWPSLLEGLARAANPACPGLLLPWRTQYYWTAYQTEWATDVMFRSREELAVLYRRLTVHGITTFSSPSVMRFLGQRVPLTGRVDGRYQGEVLSSLDHRPEGLRIKHVAGANSVKMYDKQGSVLRVETTVNNARAFKVYRPKEGGPQDGLAWRRMRQGVADLHRRAEVSQACNERYLDALANVDHSEALAACLEPVCRPVVWQGRPARPLHPFGGDAALLTAIGPGEFALNGFRNRDLQARLYAHPVRNARERRQRSARVTRQLRLLRSHGLIRKVPKTHRYQLTDKGRTLVVALGAAQQASIKKLSELAA